MAGLGRKRNVRSEVGNGNKQTFVHGIANGSRRPFSDVERSTDDICPQMVPSVLTPGTPSRRRASVPIVSATGSTANLAGAASGGRRLIAVVYADMVGYSRLIGLDDAGTISRLQTLRRELIDLAVSEHGGRIAQTAGDSLLIVFDSIDGAVRTAVAVQKQIPLFDRDQPPDRAIRFRIGINIGDVIAERVPDVHVGDGVNVARSGCQAECPPGGICVSRAVRDHVHVRLGLAFEELGALPLKNIARPVEAFVLRPESDVPPGLPTPPNRGVDKAPRLSLVVLPFRNLSCLWAEGVVPG